MISSDSIVISSCSESLTILRSLDVFVNIVPSSKILTFSEIVMIPSDVRSVAVIVILLFFASISAFESVGSLLALLIKELALLRFFSNVLFSCQNFNISFNQQIADFSGMIPV